MTRDIFYAYILSIINIKMFCIFLKICEPCKNFPTIGVPSECRITKSQCQNRIIENLRLLNPKF